ncbi:glycosyltransferase [Arthrobacter sp. yr096]|uniref:glycosyltransferase family protein n=1 Tax=Arthrobacter sp. yr096 TaxID=1761750 RepID=UPI00210C6153|nr:glycosyltransferase [Arthrobacter sp. yr096]
MSEGKLPADAVAGIEAAIQEVEWLLQDASRWQRQIDFELPPAVPSTSAPKTQIQAPTIPRVVPKTPVATKAPTTSAAQADRAKFPAMKVIGAAARGTDITVASILDPFSQTAFSYEWNNIAVEPKTWKKQLGESKPDLLFVESAWQGNNSSWLYQLTGSLAPRAEISELVAWCKENGIPTVFWNKEDPPHFEDFLKSAKLFDVVFTSDVNCVPRYRDALGHDRIHVLPFAAQPRMHNPARPQNIKRDREIAFGGMYFRHKYPERRQQMDYLLPAAQKFGLDIFSRQLGADANYQFPEPFDKNVVGSLPYEEMVTAYHAYKVFLNVNSVIDSPSMCARRIFEITACGASVVSPPSPAIERFFPDGSILTAADEKETHAHLRALMRSESYRQRLVHRAQREIWKNHTYASRVDQILDSVNLPVPARERSVSILAPTYRPHALESILENAARQVGLEKELVILTHGFEANAAEVKARANDMGLGNVSIISAKRSVTLGECLNLLVDAADGDILTKMDDDDYYGKNYLPDLVQALTFSGADLVGKAATYFYFESKDATILSYGAHEHRFTDFVRGATLTAPADVFREHRFEALGRSEDSTFLKSVKAAGGRIYAADRFNYFVRRSADVSSHTWQVADDELFATGDAEVFGDPVAHVSV